MWEKIDYLDLLMIVVFNFNLTTILKQCIMFGMLDQAFFACYSNIQNISELSIVVPNYTAIAMDMKSRNTTILDHMHVMHN